MFSFFYLMQREAVQLRRMCKQWAIIINMSNVIPAPSCKTVRKKKLELIKFRQLKNDLFQNVCKREVL